ncbi:uncharacterized protein LOC125656143 [Ostrea edulis]|uniref:uncharacterized protein LOC125656143 n=1 Tax=Ostrea edulis TaxID=37623 RepID=UPI0024AFDD66|nr:uncharacterized protein LOC125656143 [Ostrea edulis]
MTTSTMDQAIKSIWKAAGLEKDISGTKMRQGTATSVGDRFPLSKEKLAAQMNHRSATQDSFYIITQRKADAVKVTRAIKTVMRNRDQLMIEDNPTEERGPLIEEIEEEEENVPSISTCQTVQIPSHGRWTFTEGEGGVIEALWCDLIANDCTVITDHKVVDRVSRTEEGRAIIHRLEVADPSGWRKRQVDRMKNCKEKEKVNDNENI